MTAKPSFTNTVIKWIRSCRTLDQLKTCENIATKWMQDLPESTKNLQLELQVKLIEINMQKNDTPITDCSDLIFETGQG